jgi:hypothetical protein
VELLLDYKAGRMRAELKKLGVNNACSKETAGPPAYSSGFAFSRPSIRTDAARDGNSPSLSCPTAMRRPACPETARRKPFVNPAGQQSTGCWNSSSPECVCTAGGFAMSPAHIVIAALLVLVTLAGPALLPGKPARNAAAIERGEHNG